VFHCELIITGDKAYKSQCMTLFICIYFLGGNIDIKIST